jgi:hypothetical protein
MRNGSKGKVEHYLCIDVRSLSRLGLLQVGRVFDWVWGKGGEAGRVWIIVTDEDELVFNYGIWDGRTDSSVAARCGVGLSRTACHYGGKRVWFHCPRCDRRAAILHYAGPEFLCRICLRLTYASQSESEGDRRMRRARRVRDKVGGQDDLTRPFPDKPKGMHRSTYAKLRAKDAQFNRSALVDMERKLHALRSRIGVG